MILHPSGTRKSDLRARVGDVQQSLRLEPSDAGSRFRVGNAKRWISGVYGIVCFQNGHGLLDLERAHGAQRGGIRAQRRATDPSGVASQSCLENCLERCTGRGGRLGVQHMLGGLVRGDVTVQTATREATQGEVARRGFECISDAAQTRWEVARMEAPVDGVLPYIAGGRGI